MLVVYSESRVQTLEEPMVMTRRTSDLDSLLRHETPKPRAGNNVDYNERESPYKALANSNQGGLDV